MPCVGQTICIKGGIINISAENEPYDVLGMGFQGGVNVHVVELSDRFFLNIGAAYWTANEKTGSGSKLTYSNISIAPDIRYYFNGKEAGFFIGGGLSINLLQIEGEVTKTVSGPAGGYMTTTWVVEYDETEIGFHPVIGYLFNIGGTRAFIEGKYNFISNLNTLDAAVGIIFDL
jgi:hypothetical protein